MRVLYYEGIIFVIKETWCFLSQTFQGKKETKQNDHVENGSLAPPIFGFELLSFPTRQDCVENFLMWAINGSVRIDGRGNLMFPMYIV